jgi:hypothetical protein
MILVELGRADAKCSASEWLDSDFEADSINISLKEHRIKLAIGQESHVAAGDVKLIA